MPKVLIGIPTYDGWLRHELAIFLAQEAHEAEILPVLHRPTDVARNQIVSAAKLYDVLFMFDADAAPAEGTYKALLNKALEDRCVVAAPYCNSEGGLCFEGVPLAEAVKKNGFHRVENIGTHVIAYHTSVFKKIAPPYFEYDYTISHGGLRNSEDYVCHKKLADAGVPIYADFDHWAGHVKPRTVTKPRVLTAEQLDALLKMEAE